MYVQLEWNLLLFTSVCFHCDVILVSKLLYCLFCMLTQHSPGFGVQWPGRGWSGHLCHQLSVQAFCHLCLQCLWEDSRNGARWEFIVHVLTARACVLLYHSLALRIYNCMYHSHIPYFIEISLHLENPLPLKCRRMFLPPHSNKHCPWNLATW